LAPAYVYGYIPEESGSSRLSPFKVTQGHQK